MAFVGRLWIIVAALGLVAPLARGQYQVDNQVGQVDTRVGGELYGNTGPGRYPVPAQGQFRLLPSEERYAIWRSGALPSEVEMGRSAAGPLSPEGVLDYLPERSPLQRAMNLPVPRLYNHAYDPYVMKARQASYRLPARGGLPQNAQQGVEATTYRPGALAGRKPLRPIEQQAQPLNAALDRRAPGTTLLGAPDRPLPTGKLFDNVEYAPNSTPGAAWLSRSSANKGLEKIDSLGDPKK